MESMHAGIAARAPRVALATHEVRALGKLATDTARDGISRIEKVHRAIARRSWRPTGPAGTPFHAIHNLIAAGACTSVRAGFDVTGALVGAVLGEVSEGSPVARAVADACWQHPARHRERVRR